MYLSDKQKNDIYEVRRYVEVAISEMAYDAESPCSGFDRIHDRIVAKRKKGVRDAAGAVADELFNEAGTVSDLAGDRLYDVVHGDWEIPYGNTEVWNVAVKELADTFPGIKESVRRHLLRDD